MKSAILLSTSALIAASFFVLAPEKEAAGKPPSISTTRPRTRPARPFWEAAVVPEPLDFRRPAAATMPDLPSQPAPVDHPSLVARLLAQGDDPPLNAAIADWFEADPTAARDWLAGRENLDRYQTALITIAGRISRAGDPAGALQWTELLQPGPAKEQSLIDIYAFAARTQQLSDDQLRAAPLPADRIERLLNRSADD